MVHGTRVNLAQCIGDFKCFGCVRQFPAKSPLVMFRNDNNAEYAPGRVLWDFCREGCAPKYISPPAPEKAQATAPPPPAPTPTALAPHLAPPQACEGSPLVPAQQNPMEQGQLFSLAEALGVPQWRAEQLLVEHGGDGDAAGAKILRILGLNMDEDAAAEDAAPTTMVAVKPQREPAADQVLPRPQPAMPAFSTDKARHATASIFPGCVAAIAVILAATSPLPPYSLPSQQSSPSPSLPLPPPPRPMCLMGSGSSPRPAGGQLVVGPSFIGRPGLDDANHVCVCRVRVLCRSRAT